MLGRILVSSCPWPDIVNVYLICKHAVLTSASEQAAPPGLRQQVPERESITSLYQLYLKVWNPSRHFLDIISQVTSIDTLLQCLYIRLFRSLQCMSALKSCTEFSKTDILIEVPFSHMLTDQKMLAKCIYCDIILVPLLLACLDT